ncbi:predicted protein [Nematostella vectensis]|uniref:PID domain-containing protein n=1 Tax=Nematostella vectensis TaxID=45351 RepID=A7RTD0_NEMVE|nr:predicted protein [Nematostella vectensis]|eukprot:XP_001637311.1 predicted protein [Nematostella vectensis]
MKSVRRKLGLEGASKELEKDNALPVRYIGCVLNTHGVRGIDDSIAKIMNLQHSESGKKNSRNVRLKISEERISLLSEGKKDRFREIVRISLASTSYAVFPRNGCNVFVFNNHLSKEEIHCHAVISDSVVRTEAINEALFAAFRSAYFSTLRQKRAKIRQDLSMKESQRSRRNSQRTQALSSSSTQTDNTETVARTVVEIHHSSKHPTVPIATTNGRPTAQSITDVKHDLVPDKAKNNVQNYTGGIIHHRVLMARTQGRPTAQRIMDGNRNHEVPMTETNSRPPAQSIMDGNMQQRAQITATDYKAPSQSIMDVNRNNEVPIIETNSRPVAQSIMDGNRQQRAQITATDYKAPLQSIMDVNRNNEVPMIETNSRPAAQSIMDGDRHFAEPAITSNDKPPAQSTMDDNRYHRVTKATSNDKQPAQSIMDDGRYHRVTKATSNDKPPAQGIMDANSLAGGKRTRRANKSQIFEEIMKDETLVAYDV